MKKIFQELANIESALEAKGWPHYEDNPDLCMARAKEFLDERDALMARHGTTWDAFRATAEKSL